MKLLERKKVLDAIADFAEITEREVSREAGIAVRALGIRLCGMPAERRVACRDCVHFAVKDYWTELHGFPILGASHQPTCTKWGEGDCKTSPDGWCFLGEARDDAKDG